MACELLQGIDIDELSPPEGLPRYPVHFPDGVDPALVAHLYAAGEGSASAGRLRRYAPLRSTHHWQPASLTAAVQVVAARPDATPSLGIAAAAIDDFRHVWQAKLEGRLRPDTRFVVSLPTPYTMIAGLDAALYSPPLLASLERVVAAELAALLQTVPARELAIQFDVCAETRLWESRGRELGAPRDLPERLLQGFVALAEAVPKDAELGWHFCHRGPAGSVTSPPHDAAQVTRLAGAIIASTDREPAFLDVPVPAGRDDADYFAPLANLALWPSMDVHLALLHPGDDVERAWQRLYAASTVLGRFGISPACGADAQAVLPVLGQLLARTATDVPAGDDD
jgi:hypothetical protein